MERVPIPKNPELFDRVISDIQKGLADNLPWLDHSFGRAERLVKSINGKKYYTPDVYAGGNDYILIAPDDKVVGNFSFFVIDDPQDVDWITGRQSDYKAQFSLIVWVDMRRVTNEADNRNTEAVKFQIMRALNGGFWLKSGSIKINRIYERAENVFKGFTFNELDNQFLMHPFAGFRFEGVMTVKETCYNQ